MGLIWHGNTDLRLVNENPQSLADAGYRPNRSLRAFLLEKGDEFCEVGGRVRGKNYVWHSGTDNSLSVPTLASHRSTSAKFVCKPVSS